MQQSFVFDVLNPILSPSKFDPAKQYVNLWIAFRDPVRGRVTASIQTSDPGIVSLASYKGCRFSCPARAIQITRPCEPDGTPMLSKTTGQPLVNVEVVEETEITYVGLATPPAAKIVGLPALLAAAPAAPSVA